MSKKKKNSTKQNVNNEEELPVQTNIPNVKRHIENTASNKKLKKQGKDAKIQKNKTKKVSKNNNKSSEKVVNNSNAKFKNSIPIKNVETFKANDSKLKKVETNDKSDSNNIKNKKVEPIKSQNTKKKSEVINNKKHKKIEKKEINTKSQSSNNKTNKKTKIIPQEHSMNKYLMDKILEYFINSINDEDEQVRSLSIILFSSLTEHNKYKLPDDYITQISYNLIDDTSDIIDIYTMNIFTNIKYKSSHILKFVIHKIIHKLDLPNLVLRIYSIFIKNFKLVKDFYKYKNILEPEQELFNKKYIVEIVASYVLRDTVRCHSVMRKHHTLINTILNKHYSITNVKGNIIQNTNVQSKLTNPKINLVNIKHIEDLLKNNLIKYLNKEDYKNVFLLKNNIPEYYLFIRMLYKGLVKNNKKGILKMSENFKGILLNERILEDKDSLIQFIKDIDLLSVKKKGLSDI